MSVLIALNAKISKDSVGLVKEYIASPKFCQLVDSFTEVLSDTRVKYKDKFPKVNLPALWICRIKPPRVLLTGLQMTGTLWAFTSYLDFTCIPEVEEWHKEWKGRGFY
jgi:hypothetical protein